MAHKAANPFINRADKQSRNSAIEKISGPLANPMLAQLRPQNLLPPHHKDQIAPNSYQLASLIRWSGLNTQELSDLLGMKDKRANTVLRWTSPYKQQGIEKDTGDKLIRPAVFQYLLIILGLLPPPSLRRVEPNTTTEKIYSITTNPFTLAARIDYQSGKINIYMETQNIFENDGKPLLTFDAQFSVDSDLNAIKIGSKFRKDECPWCIESDEETELSAAINDFLKEEVWPMAWRLHDFYTLKPEIFLRPQCMLSIYHPDYQVPDPIELIRFKRWLGATTADLADVVWEMPSALRYWASSKASDSITELLEELETLTNSTTKEEKDRKTSIYKLIKNRHISPQGWYILTSAIGLSPKIQVVGRKEVNPTLSRQFVTKEISGTPIEYYNVNVNLGWANTDNDEIYVNYAYDTHKQKGVEKTTIIPISKNGNGDIKIFGNLFEEGAPENWVSLFEYPDNKELLEHIQRWFHFVVWKKVWQQVWDKENSTKPVIKA